MNICHNIACCSETATVEKASESGPESLPLLGMPYLFVRNVALARARCLHSHGFSADISYPCAFELWQ